jgi:RimJ/RimL family protein N-acetyltransferase
MRRDEIERFFQVRALGPGSLAMAIHVRDSGRLIGSCAFSQLDGDNGAALFHITIGEPDAWGHGYGTEATALMVDHAFGTLGLHRVALSVFAFNERALRAYRKVGFVLEGRSREAIWRDGRWWDELHMSLLVHEWVVLRGTAAGAGEAVPSGAAMAPGEPPTQPVVTATRPTVDPEPARSIGGR